jgi:hypothetical protein
MLVAFLVTGCTASVGGDRDGTPLRSTSWEYKQDAVCVAGHLPVNHHEARIGSILEQRGREGWELISAAPSTSGTETCYLLIFKRPKV